MEKCKVVHTISASFHSAQCENVRTRAILCMLCCFGALLALEVWKHKVMEQRTSIKMFGFPNAWRCKSARWMVRLCTAGGQARTHKRTEQCKYP
eukprot:1858620-Amphidinium_carterae.1